TTSKATAKLETMAFRKDFSTTLWVMNPTDEIFQDLQFHIDGTGLHPDSPVQIKTWRDDDPTLEGVDRCIRAEADHQFTINLPSESLTRIRFNHLGFLGDQSVEALPKK
ncbi:MAG: hypothetical protein ACQKBU_00090, partial [Verrucomicrobiales bacterium]